MSTAEQERVEPEPDTRHPGRVVAIVNPTAGRGLGRKAFVQLRELLPRLCSDAELYLSHEPGFATKLLEGLPLAPGTIVIAAGGDGTVHEIGEVLLGREGVSLGVIAVGSGNDMAHQLAMPSSVPEALRALLAGTALPWDVGRIGDHHFLNSVGFALSAETCWWSHRSTRLRGFGRYFWAVARAWWSYRPVVLELTGTGWSGRRPVAYLELAVGDRAGGGFKVTPRALVDDGLLDLCALEALSRWAILPLAGRARRGAHVEHQAVHYEQLADFGITLDRPTRVHIDGEIVELAAGTHGVSIEPGALQIIVAPSHPRLAARAQRQIADQPGAADQPQSGDDES